MTLAVGDGANDVAMILKAHVGVGIAGREGMQAARSSDYAIGKFKFLRPLLFLHGREAYRKISFLVCYNFYKNVLYVIVQYYFGFNSVFSGQTLYEPWVYQLYNVCFTGAAIFFWGVFDFEFEKDKFMKEPLLYRVGIEGRLFNTKVFWGWQLYALYEALIILFIGLVITQMSPVSDGKTFNFWAGGHIVYFECVLTANFILLRSTHNFTGWCELLIFLQVTSFFWLLYLDSIWLTSPISYFFDEFFGSLTAWLGVLFVGGILVIEKAAVDAYVFIGPRLNWCRFGKRGQVAAMNGKLSLTDGDESMNPRNLDIKDMSAIPISREPIFNESQLPSYQKFDDEITNIVEELQGESRAKKAGSILDD